MGLEVNLGGTTQRISAGKVNQENGDKSESMFDKTEVHHRNQENLSTLAVDFTYRDR